MTGAVSSRLERFRQRAVLLLAPDRMLAAPDRAAFAVEVAAFNQRRVRQLLPFMAAIHILVGIGILARPSHPSPAELRWYHDLLICHRLMLPVAVLLTAGAWFLPATNPLVRRLGEISTFVYMALCVGIGLTDQILFPNNIAALLLAYLTTAALFRLGALFSAITYVGAMIAFMVALPSWLGADAGAAPASALSTLVTVSVIAWVLGRSAYGAMARELVARRTIERQTAELDELTHAQARLNDELERRVSDQVGQIVERAGEVEALNAQLKDRVKERSRELSQALARLADARGGDSATLPAGTVLGERVVIERLLGRGGMGAVYLAQDKLSGSRVAVKVVQAASTSELDGLHRFLREATLTASVSHPGIVRSLHVDVSADGRLFQVLELVDGEPLSSALARLGRLPAPAATRIAGVVAEALAAAHQAGVIHRDVKPANIMLTRVSPGVKLLDFGVSKLRDQVLPEAGTPVSGEGFARPSSGGGVEAVHSTRHGFMVGTPEFMAPEQISSAATATGAADVYALGVVLYTVVAGRSPFDARTTTGFMNAHANITPHPLVRFAPAAPAPLVELIDRCLAKDPAGRPLAADLAGALASLADRLAAPPAEQLDIASREHEQLAAAATLAAGPGDLDAVGETRDVPRRQ
jgi:serine/threonine-protein kinase